jgi:hypothetical protein
MENSWIAGLGDSLVSAIRNCLMNELYAANPAVCSQFSDLKLLMASFGPYTGRYLANYPIDWGARVEISRISCSETKHSACQSQVGRKYRVFILFLSPCYPEGNFGASTVTQHYGSNGRRRPSPKRGNRKP